MEPILTQPSWRTEAYWEGDSTGMPWGVGSERADQEKEKFKVRLRELSPSSLAAAAVVTGDVSGKCQASLALGEPHLDRQAATSRCRLMGRGWDDLLMLSVRKSLPQYRLDHRERRAVVPSWKGGRSDSVTLWANCRTVTHLSICEVTGPRGHSGCTGFTQITEPGDGKAMTAVRGLTWDMKWT